MSHDASVTRGPGGNIRPTPPPVQAPPAGVVRNYLECSTMHLDSHEGMGLDTLADLCEPVVAYAYDEGAWVWVPTRRDDFEHRNWMRWENLRRVLEYARRLDCDWVRFDCHGPELPDLPQFRW